MGRLAGTRGWSVEFKPTARCPSLGYFAKLTRKETFTCKTSNLPKEPGLSFLEQGPVERKMSRASGAYALAQHRRHRQGP